MYVYHLIGCENSINIHTFKFVVQDMLEVFRVFKNIESRGSMVIEQFDKYLHPKVQGKTVKLMRTDSF